MEIARVRATSTKQGNVRYNLAHIQSASPFLTYELSIGARDRPQSMDGIVPIDGAVHKLLDHLIVIKPSIGKLWHNFNYSIHGVHSDHREAMR